MDDWYTSKEVAQMLGYTKGGVQHLRERGHLPATWDGTRYLFRKDDFEAFLEKRRRLEETYTTNEAADILGITRSGVIAHIRSKRIPASKRGYDWFIRKSDLDAYIEQRRKPGRPPETKTCKTCGIDKPLTAFQPTKNGLWGCRARCRDCYEAKRSAHRKGVGGDNHRAYARAQYYKDPAYASQKSRRWKRANREHYRDTYRKWVQTPNGRAAIRRGAHRRRIRLLAVTNDVTTAQIAELMQRQTHCAYCKKKFTDKLPSTIDHVIPVSKGGPHTISNLVLACRPCNSSKHDNEIFLL